jgi:hypothetical protein
MPDLAIGSDNKAHVALVAGRVYYGPITCNEAQSYLSETGEAARMRSSTGSCSSSRCDNSSG